MNSNSMAGLMTTLLTVPETAARLSMSTKAVRRLIDRGDLQAVNVAPTGANRRTLRVDQRTLDLFVAVRMTGGKVERKLKCDIELEYLLNHEHGEVRPCD